MTKSTQTLTQSGMLAVLLQRQRYKVIQLARRSAHRKRVRAAFLEYPHLVTAAFTAPKLVDGPPPHLNLSPGQLPCLTKSIPTASSGNRFTTTSQSNTPNGSSQMANP